MEFEKLRRDLDPGDSGLFHYHRHADDERVEVTLGGDGTVVETERC